MNPNQQPSIQQNSMPQQPVSQIPSSGSKWKLILLIIILLVIAGGGAYYLGVKQNTLLSQNQQKTITPTIAQSAPVLTPEITSIPTQTAPTLSQDTTANWKTYVSTTEKASFKYPSDWTIVKPAIESNFPEADQTALQSPSGKIKVSWVSALDGFGGGCDDKIALGQEGACPLFTLIDKTPISGAQGLYAISGTITTNGTNYKPFLAVQGNEIIGLLSTKRTMGYDMFTGKNNGSLPEIVNNTTALFSTSGPYGDGPSLTQTDAAAWFNNTEVQQAKLILLSLTYQQ